MSEDTFPPQVGDIWIAETPGGDKDEPWAMWKILRPHEFNEFMYHCKCVDAKHGGIGYECALEIKPNQSWRLMDRDL